MDMIEQPASGMVREVQEPADPSRAALVDEKCKLIEEAKKHWDKDFKRMRASMDMVSGKQWPGQKDDDDRYVANIVQRVIKTQVASLYAKNPRVVARRRKRLDYTIWDGKPQSLMMAQQALMNAAADPIGAQQAMALLADVQQNQQRVQMIERVGQTLEVLIDYYMTEQVPDFKTQMKQAIRRSRTTGVGYIELGFQREMKLTDDQSTRISDMAERLAAIGRLQADLQDGEADPWGPETEELRLAIQGIEQNPEMIVREGIFWSFPQSTRIIPAPETQKLVGWVGAPWVAKEVILHPDRVKEVYGVDLGKAYTSYKIEAGRPWGGSRKKGKGDGLACVWHFYCRETGLEYVLADGHPDFLQEPAPPVVQVEQFFPFWPLVFNDMENEDELFPKSDVDLLRHQQREYNRSKEGIRQHRIANRPLYLAPAGQFDEDEAKNLANHAAHDVIEVKAMRDGVKPEDLIAPVKKIGVDPNLYETESIFADMLRVVGTQEANLGGMSGGTATESSIAESSRQGSVGLDSDDLDDTLSSVMRAAGQVMLMELDTETVTQIAGPGAVWPELSRLEIMQEITLEVKAGSSGRPNKAQDAATFERMAPFLLQVPGINPQWLAERMLKIADDDTHLEDAWAEGMPSIMALNRQMQVGTGNPETDQQQQGDKGGDNQEGPPQTGGSAQPGFTMGAQPNQVQ